MTFRKPATMEENVSRATKLYSEAQEESGLIYPTYEESKKRFKKAFRTLKEVTATTDTIDEHTSLETRVEYVRAFQEFSNAYESLVTYDDYNNEMEASPALKEQVSILEEQVETYETVKGSLMEIEEESDVTDEDFSGITFYSDASVKLYDIDSAYIDQLLGTYAANSSDVREELEKALQKLNKTEQVKDVYRSILTAIDQHEVPENEDIFSLKRHFFTQERNHMIQAFAHEWFVSEEELQSSAMQYMIGMEPIPNMGNVIESKNYEGYKSIHPEMKPFKYPQAMKRAWREVLDDALIPLKDELR